MQRHALALGYFFLAAFCGYPLTMASEALRWVYLVAALAALAGAIVYLDVLPAAGKWLSNMFTLAQEPPRH
jgi:hypothetical protein